MTRTVNTNTFRASDPSEMNDQTDCLTAFRPLVASQLVAVVDFCLIDIDYFKELKQEKANEEAATE